MPLRRRPHSSASTRRIAVMKRSGWIMKSSSSVSTTFSRRCPHRFDVNDLDGHRHLIAHPRQSEETQFDHHHKFRHDLHSFLIQGNDTAFFTHAGQKLDRRHTQVRDSAAAKRIESLFHRTRVPQCLSPCYGLEPDSIKHGISPRSGLNDGAGISGVSVPLDDMVKFVGLGV
jgi:hypothetical protein